MRKTGLAVVSALLVGAAAAVEIDGIAARVGEDAILRSDVFAEMRRAGASDDSLYPKFLNDLIDRRLILRAAKQAKVTMQDWVVESRVRELVSKSFGGDRNRLVEALARQRQTYPEWHARTREDMIVGAMRWNVVDKNVSASPAALRREFRENRSRYVRDHRVTVTAIFLKPEERGRREEISAALKEKTFEELGARKYEDVKPEEAFKPEIAAEIARMPKGGVSKWLEIDGWSFLLRKDDETQGKALSFEEAYDDVVASVREAEARRLYLDWIRRLRSEAYVKTY